MSESWVAFKCPDIMENYSFPVRMEFMMETMKRTDPISCVGPTCLDGVYRVFEGDCADNVDEKCVIFVWLVDDMLILCVVGRNCVYLVIQNGVPTILTSKPPNVCCCYFVAGNRSLPSVELYYRWSSLITTLF